MIITKRHTNILKLLVATSVVILAIAGVVVNLQSTSRAADLSKFDPGDIMSDSIMSNKNSMSVGQIQAFLESKNLCNNTNTYLASWYPHLQYNIRDGKFVCMAKDTFNGKSAAQIIWQAAQDYSINPQVILVLLEKEQGLITDNWPNHIQYRSATGFGCPDTAACDSQYFGLENQIRQAANLFRNVLNGGWSNYPVGNTYVQYNPNAACGGSVINIKNRATSALYRYTPYQPNQSALNAGYGTGDGCSAHGNRNFYALFTDWFGSTKGVSALPQLKTRYEAMGSDLGALGRIAGYGYCLPGESACWQEFDKGYIIWSPTTGAWESKGGIRTRWSQIGYQSGVLGFPIGPENWEDNGWWQSYQNGVIVGKTATGFWESMGPIRTRWGQIGYQNSFMGYPRGSISYGHDKKIAWQEYENGYIYWSESGGTWESKGGIRNQWAKLGYGSGVAGNPIGPEEFDATNKTWFQEYQNGTIYYSDSRGGWFAKSS